MQCKKCGSDLRRLARKGFLQKEIYPRFGYYPWECPVCRGTLMLKKQYQRKKHRVPKSNAAD
jgi:competence CoiA-like predicted nuclease